MRFSVNSSLEEMFSVTFAADMALLLRVSSMRGG